MIVLSHRSFTLCLSFNSLIISMVWMDRTHLPHHNIHEQGNTRFVDTARDIIKSKPITTETGLGAEKCLCLDPPSLSIAALSLSIISSTIHVPSIVHCCRRHLQNPFFSLNVPPGMSGSSLSSITTCHRRGIRRG